jgi:anti-anti-sigma factor
MQMQQPKVFRTGRMMFARRKVGDGGSGDAVPCSVKSVSPVLQVTLERSADGVRVHLAGEMDVATAGQLVEVVQALKPEDLRHVRVDVTDLVFMDASGLTALLEVRAHLLDRGGRLSLCGVGPRFIRLLEITDLLTVLDVGAGAVIPDQR